MSEKMERRRLWRIMESRPPCKFTGKIDKVTIDLKEMKTAEKLEENKGLALAAQKKALSY